MPSVDFDDTDGQTMAILASPQVVSLRCLASGWTPRSLLDFVATRQSRSQTPLAPVAPFCALIDTGALLCGLENEEVAKLLMDSPLNSVKDACIFLARGTDLPMILLKGATQAVPLEDANIRPERRFCYFDQPHTTGIDIQQPPLGAPWLPNSSLFLLILLLLFLLSFFSLIFVSFVAILAFVILCFTKVACITIGKDMSIRELQQGAWRMRGLAKGQGCEMLLPEEVALYMRTVLKDDKALNIRNFTTTTNNGYTSTKVDEELAEALRDIQSALLLKALEQEELQARQLVRQDLLSAWKDEALATLLTGGNGSAQDSVKSVKCLLESVPTSISTETKTLEKSLRDLAEPFATTSSVRAAVDAAVQRAMQMLGILAPNERPTLKCQMCQTSTECIYPKCFQIPTSGSKTCSFLGHLDHSIHNVFCEFSIFSISF